MMHDHAIRAVTPHQVPLRELAQVREVGEFFRVGPQRVHGRGALGAVAFAAQCDVPVDAVAAPELQVGAEGPRLRVPHVASLFGGQQLEASRHS